MKKAGSVELWESLAQEEPYWSIVAVDEFRRRNLSPERLEGFFRGGAQHVQAIHDEMNSRFGESSKPKIALDFGCGVGRFLLPLAGMSKTAVGLDISPTMLALCREHAKQRRISNLELYETDDELSTVMRYEGSVDLLTSFTVFQHIAPRQGARILRKLLSLVRPGGRGFLDFPFAAAASSLIHEPAHGADARYGFFQRTTEGLLKLVESPAESLQPPIHHYNINETLCIFYQAGISDLTLKVTHNANTMAAELFFRKPV